MTNVCYKFQLIIDGCNGPIRFREENLRRTSARATSQDDITCNNNDTDNENETILSLLRPESIAEAAQRKSGCKSSKSKKGTKCRRKKKHKPKNNSVLENSTRLDMIPLLQKLLISSNRNDKRETYGEKLFDSIAVIFDGVSITKRPLVQKANAPEEERMEEEITRGRFWRVTSDDSSQNATEVVPAGGTGICNDMEYQNGWITIEITGLYDEADNVIVNRIQDHHSRVIESNASPNGTTDATKEYLARIQVLRRTERGAGKNRRLFQPLGLLRSESVACVFEFAAPFNTSSDESSQCQKGDTSENNLREDQQPRTHSTPFYRLALDGHQTLQSLRRQNPGNVFLIPDDSIEIPYDAGSNDGCPVILPIVVTDDIFLRQRIVHEGGYVMTFHQLWLLLIDVA